MMEQRDRVYLPAQFEISGAILDSPVRQLRRPEGIVEARTTMYGRGRSAGQLIAYPDGRRTLVVPRLISLPEGIDELLVSDGDFSSEMPAANPSWTYARWMAPRPLDPSDLTTGEWERRRQQVVDSWSGQFSFRRERRRNGQVIAPGLRAPQIGALHATLAHWTVADDPATIVMPTGTGKTETMLALLVHEGFECLLVVVPTAQLREQIGTKFVELGVLKRSGVVDQAALYPIVGFLEHRPRSVADVDTFFGACQVVVTTMAVLGGCAEDVQQRIADRCGHLFIDEAHHISAPTWRRFRELFTEKPICQFTATPFRGDGKHIPGKVVFNYPLRRAQEDEYFRPITFIAVDEFNPRQADAVIARKAVEQLDADLGQGLNHLLMARTNSIERATQVHALYERIAPAHRPVLIHSNLSVAERRSALEQIRASSSRIVVCVDMFGEGFDLPELKIAALHDMHKGLAITLQFMGRFTRVQDGLGDATVVANIADAEVEASLQELYAEDADWNYLLRHLSEGANTRHARRSAFLQGFGELPSEIPLQNIFPKMSTVVYRTSCADWQPATITSLVPDARLAAGPLVNATERVLLFVTCERVPIEWGDIRDVYDTIWDLYLVHWDANAQLLYVHSSNNDGFHDEVARAVAGDDVTLIRDEEVFRALHGINRLILMNLGLKNAMGRAIRFTMYVGADVLDALAQPHLQHKIKSNIFARGFEQGDTTALGCSSKGRLWANRDADSIEEWVDWCHSLGAKLLNDQISVEEILRHVLRPQQIQARPALVPLSIDWPVEFLQRNEAALHFDVAGDCEPFHEVGLEISEHRADGPLRFQVFTAAKRVEYEVVFRGGGVEYRPTGADSVDYVTKRRRVSLSEQFQREPPVIRFENGASLEYDTLVTLPADGREPFDRERIVVWDWSGTQLNVESQTWERFPHSIQRRVILDLLRPDHDPYYDLVIDDDDTHEAADIVALKVSGDRLIVHLFHCKYTRERAPGARVADLYAVCGQAQQSAHWKGEIRKLFEHLRNRDLARTDATGVSRFERGDLQRLGEIARRAPQLTSEFKIWIVQPGISKQRLQDSHLDLLAVTELYLQETYGIPFEVIGSA